MVLFFFSFLFSLSSLLPSLQFSRACSAAAVQCVLMTHGYRHHSGQRNDYCAVKRSSKTIRAFFLSFFPPLRATFGELRKKKACKLSQMLKRHSHTTKACTHTHCRSYRLQSRSSLINELQASVSTSCGVMLP